MIRKTSMILICTLIALSLNNASLKAAENKGPKILVCVGSFLMGASKRLFVLDDGRVINIQEGGAWQAAQRSGTLTAKQLKTLKKTIQDSKLLSAKFTQADDPMLLTDGGTRLTLQLDAKSASLAPPRAANYNAQTKALNKRIAAFRKSFEKLCQSCLKDAPAKNIESTLLAMLSSDDMTTQAEALSNLRTLGKKATKARPVLKKFKKRCPKELKPLLDVTLKDVK